MIFFEKKNPPKQQTFKIKQIKDGVGTMNTFFSFFFTAGWKEEVERKMMAIR